jgi:hypothetical protein
MALMEKAQAYQDKMRKQNMDDIRQYGSQFSAAYGVGLPEQGTNKTAQYMAFQKYFKPVGTDKSDLSGIAHSIENASQGGAKDVEHAARMVNFGDKYGTKLSKLLSPEANDYLSRLDEIVPAELKRRRR